MYTYNPYKPLNKYMLNVILVSIIHFIIFVGHVIAGNNCVFFILSCECLIHWLLIFFIGAFSFDPICDLCLICNNQVYLSYISLSLYCCIICLFVFFSVDTNKERNLYRILYSVFQSK